MEELLSKYRYVKWIKVGLPTNVIIQLYTKNIQINFYINEKTHNVYRLVY